MNIREMIEFHEQKRAQATIAAIPVPKEQAREFGVIEAGAGRRAFVGFHEKNADAPTMPGDPDRVSTRRWATTSSPPRPLLRELYADAATSNSSHDFGRDILPSLVGRAAMFAYDFQTNRIPGDPPDQAAYWRDVGTIDAYYDANMDLRAVTPALNLYNRQWPLRTAGYSDAPAKFTFDEEGRRGQAIDSIVSGGSILSGGTGAQFDARPRRAGALRRGGGGFDHVRQLRYRPARARCAGRSSTRTCGCRRTRTSATTSSTTSASTT